MIKDNNSQKHPLLKKIMETIPIKAIIGDYFIKNSEKREISFSTLNQFKKGLENKFRKKNSLVQVKYYREDLRDLANRPPESFEVDFDSEEIKYLNGKNNIYLVNSIPHKIKNDYAQFFLEVNSEIT